jgi:hypothetical protein
MKSIPYFVIAGVILFGVGLFYLIRGEAIVGIKGFTKSLRGIGAMLIGGIYCLAGIVLIGTIAIESTNAIPLQLGTVIFILVVSIIGYFFAE